MKGSTTPSVHPETSDEPQNAHQSTKDYYASQLMQHEWMTDIPEDLGQSWYYFLLHLLHSALNGSSGHHSVRIGVLLHTMLSCRIVLPRPEGQRCLIVASKNHTVSYSKKGVTVHRFLSLLPGGSPQTGKQITLILASLPFYVEAQSAMYLLKGVPLALLVQEHTECMSMLQQAKRLTYRAVLAGGKADAVSVLDCIFCRESNSYIVMDIMCWAGYQLYDCVSEFRMYWAHSKLQELPQQGRCGRNSNGFLPVPLHQCDPGTAYL